MIIVAIERSLVEIIASEAYIYMPNVKNSSYLMTGDTTVNVSGPYNVTGHFTQSYAAFLPATVERQRPGEGSAATDNVPMYLSNDEGKCTFVPGQDFTSAGEQSPLGHDQQSCCDACSNNKKCQVRAAPVFSHFLCQSDI